MSDDQIMVVPPGDGTQRSLDLSPFIEINRTKISWDERVQLIQKQFPSVVKTDWYKIFNSDPVILGRLINDILKVDQATPGKPGKRPAIDVGLAEERLRQLMGEDYTVLPFHEAFRVLIAERSIRHVATKTGLNKDLVHRLLQGSTTPTGDMMQIVARAFNKEPGFFYEYRIAYIFGVMMYKLDSSPESTVSFYKRLKDQCP